MPEAASVSIRALIARISSNLSPTGSVIGPSSPEFATGAGT